MSCQNPQAGGLPRLRMLGLVAGLSAACPSANGEETHGNGDSGTNDVTVHWGGGAGDAADSASESGPDSSGGADSGSSSADASDSSPLSCAPGGAGMTDCGSDGESCCASLEVTGGTYGRTYTSGDDGGTVQGDPATVSSFRLDKYEVTIGRFRQFVSAWDGGAGYAPSEGSGKHSHLNGGKGLANSGADAGVMYEMGWMASDDSKVAPTNADLACESQFDTWTASAGSQENLPINCVNWYEAYAFCIWDGGFLPSEAEWEAAAAGENQQREYPWGTVEPGTTNKYAIYDCYYPSDSGACTGGAAPVGTATLGAGLWGQLDLAGNVNEWNLDSYAAYVDTCVDCAYLTADSYRVLRGGYFFNYALYLAPAVRSDDRPAVRSICIGFRCARTP